MMLTVEIHDIRYVAQVPSDTSNQLRNTWIRSLLVGSISQFYIGMCILGFSALAELKNWH